MTHRILLSELHMIQDHVNTALVDAREILNDATEFRNKINIILTGYLSPKNKLLAIDHVLANTYYDSAFDIKYALPRTTADIEWLNDRYPEFKD